jgi:hypothetical protein
MIVASAASLNALDRHISDLGGLISLGLVLVTVFTAQRWQAMRDRRGIPGRTKQQALEGALVDLGLLLLTSLLAVAAGPLMVDAVRHSDFGHTAGALRSTFVVVWALLIGLVLWQGSIAARSLRQMHRRPWRKSR